MSYVIHFCKNKKCDSAWIDKDITNVTSIPPKWKYCRKCCEERGIDFDSQTPDSNLTSKELKEKEELKEKMKKLRERRKK